MKIVYLMELDEQNMWEALESVGLAYRQYDPEDPDNQPPANPMDAEGFVPTGAYTWVFKDQMGGVDMFGTIWVKTGATVPGDDGPVDVIEPLDNNFYANLALYDDEFDVSALPLVDPAPTTPYRVFLGESQ